MRSKTGRPSSAVMPRESGASSIPQQACKNRTALEYWIVCFRRRRRRGCGRPRWRMTLTPIRLTVIPAANAAGPESMFPVVVMDSGSRFARPGMTRECCPTRQISESHVQPCLQKYFRSLPTQISCISLAIPAHTQGAFRDRHERRARDAMDAGGAADESAYLRTAKSCGPDAPTLASSFAEATPRATVANKPGHRGEREISC